jgi:tetratricopeptide (TPR) repeat protein
MKIKKIFTVTAFIIAGLQISFAQNTNESQPRPTPPPPIASPDLNTKVSEGASKYLNQITDTTPVPRERREQAYASLLEGQRYLWSMRPPSSPAAAANNARLAKQSFQKAVELNPTLAEGYTVLAEITLQTPPYNLEEAILLAAIAVKIEPENFGGHRILARLYTIKSRLNTGILDSGFAQKAIAEWKEVARLDPRNAEAYAFLSEFYARTNKSGEQVDALNRWLASSAALDTRFYSNVMGGQADLSPDSALIKLGAAQLKAGQTREAVEVLSRAVADNPNNEEAVELLSRAIESADASSAAIAVQSLQQAVYANSENPTLAEILAQVHVRAGKVDEAAKVLRETSAKLAVKDKIPAALLHVSLGDIYARASRFDEAVAAFQTALTVRGINESELVMDEARDFAIRVFDKMIETYKRANRLSEAKAVIERARVVLGKSDLFADKRLVSFYLETGKKAEALQAIRALRVRNAEDFSLVRTEAEILTGSGRVDEAVELLKTAFKKKPAASGGQGTEIVGGEVISSSPMYDEFSNLLFISNLYTRAKRGKEAAEAANAAYALTANAERKQIAKLTLATSQQTTGDFKSAEGTLREILKQTPRNPIALNNLGYFLAERGEKLDEALKLIEQAVEIDPTNPSFLDSLGWAYFKLGKLVEAEKYLKDAVQIDDSSSTIHEHLGDVYQKQGKVELAKTAWKKALNLSSEADETNRIKAKLAKYVLK